jgi:formylglycine-generating enzyme required for sulfatase activity
MGAGAWGQLDLVGEMFEWNLDWYANSYVNPCTDCAYLTTTSYRAFRGGSFRDNPLILWPWESGYGITPTPRNSTFGVRCSRAP